MKPACLLMILLASALAFPQSIKVSNVSATGCPLSLSTKAESGLTIIMAHNNSSKGVLALVAVTDVTGVSGDVIPITSRGDLVFKVNAIGPGQDRGIGFIDSSELAPAPPDPDGSVRTEGAVLFVQFEDGSTWGDPQAAKEMIAVRPEKLAFLKHLVEIYDASGDAAFTSALNETQLGSPLYSVAGCLKSDAEYEKMPVIDLARKRLVAAQAWQASGIF